MSRSKLSFVFLLCFGVFVLQSNAQHQEYNLGFEKKVAGTNLPKGWYGNIGDEYSVGLDTLDEILNKTLEIMHH